MVGMPKRYCKYPSAFESFTDAQSETNFVDFLNGQLKTTLSSVVQRVSALDALSVCPESSPPLLRSPTTKNVSATDSTSTTVLLIKSQAAGSSSGSRNCSRLLRFCRLHQP